MTKRGLIACASAVALLGTAFSAHALDLSVGGISVSVGSGSGGGTSVSVGGGGGTGVSATIGGGSNIVSTGVGAGGTGLNVGVGSAGGPLITTNQTGGTTSANVNLGLGDAGLGDIQGLLNSLSGTTGDLLDGIDFGDIGGPGGGPGGGVGGAGFGVAFASLSAGEQQFLRLRCRAVLSSPTAFDSNIVALCRMIAKL